MKNEIHLLQTQGLLGAENLPLNTIFMGGGTPSKTDPQQMGEIFAEFLPGLNKSENFEWTMEANPSSVSQEKLTAYRGMGVNRLSLGVQSLNNEELKILGRVHDEEEALRAVDAALAAGFENISVDLMCGLPGQKLSSLENNLKKLTALPIRHLSCYLLTLPKTHRLAKQMPNEETQIQQLLFIDAFMREQGFRHYEISNYSRPGFEARHNLHYWNKGSYLGLGPSAHSYDHRNQRRWKNFSSLSKYSSLIEKGELPIEWREDLTRDQQELETWLLALRLDTGFPKSWLTSDPQIRSMALLTEHGYLEFHPEDANSIRLTALGFTVSDWIIEQLSPLTKSNPIPYTVSIAQK